MKLKDKVAIVTGSGQGIGRSIAMLFAREGATVIVNDISAEMNNVVQEIKNAGGTAVPFKANIANKTEVDNMFSTVMEEFKAIHILVNNAAIRRNVPFLELSEADWDLVLDVDLKSVFLCMQKVAGYMVQQQYGKIVNIASLAALGACRPDQANYAAAKAGVIALTKVGAVALGQYHINVNGIAPGTTATPSSILRRGKEGTEKFYAEHKKAMALGRVATPEDMANLALFLASDDSSYITGQVIACEGGRKDLMLW